MKKIINGKKYDTQTATLIGEDSSSCGKSDFNWYEEDLYQKRTGEFFLNGRGGAMSSYSSSCGQNSWGAGEKIIPLSEIEAKEWVERICSLEIYEQLFGKIEE